MASISRSPFYLVHAPFSYCFRMAVPQDVQPYIGKRELRYSLRTGYLSTAKSKSRLMTGRVQQLFQELRSNQGRFMELTDAQIQEMAIKYLERIKAEMDEPFGPDRGDRPYGDKASLDDYINGLADNKGDIREEIAMGDYWRVSDRAIALLKGAGVSADGIDEESASFTKLCENLLVADLRGIDYHKERLTGIASTDIEQAFDGVMRKGASAASVPPEPEEKPSILLSELWEEYQTRKVEAGHWRSSTIRNHSPKAKALMQFIGDKPVNQITKPMIRNYRKLLDRLPPNFVKKGYPDLSVVDPNDLVGKHGKTMDITTVLGYMTRTKALFQFAKDNDYIGESPVVSGMMPLKKKHSRELRHPFSDPSELEQIFEKDRFLKWSKDKQERFWVPILALLTGCRLEEMCQLHVDDVKRIDGIWCIDVKGLTGAAAEGEEGEQMLKNESAPRAVPLHPILVEDFKFPDYVNGLRLSGDSLIFPHLEKSEKTNWKYSHGLSKSFGQYLRKKVGISDRKKTFHNFRHTVANHLYNTTFNDSIIEELEGRAGKTETRKTYTQGYQAKTLYEQAVLKLNYKVDLSHLKASKWVPKD